MNLTKLRAFDSTPPTRMERLRDFWDQVPYKKELGIVLLGSVMLKGCLMIADQAGDIDARIEAAHLREPLDGSVCETRTVQPGDIAGDIARRIAAEVDVNLREGQGYQAKRPSIEDMTTTIGDVTRRDARDVELLMPGEKYLVCIDPYGRTDIFLAD